MEYKVTLVCNNCHEILDYEVCTEDDVDSKGQLKVVFLPGKTHECPSNKNFLTRISGQEEK